MDIEWKLYGERLRMECRQHVEKIWLDASPVLVSIRSDTFDTWLNKLSVQDISSLEKSLDDVRRNLSFVRGMHQKVVK